MGESLLPPLPPLLALPPPSRGGTGGPPPGDEDDAAANPRKAAGGNPAYNDGDFVSWLHKCILMKTTGWVFNIVTLAHAIRPSP